MIRGAALMHVLPAAAVTSSTGEMTVTTTLGCQSMIPATAIHRMTAVAASVTADARSMAACDMLSAAMMSSSGVMASAAMVSAATVMATPTMMSAAVTTMCLGDGSW
jgi:hypothetical protein